jgi:transcriptional regulator with XRE-family HTH domain
VSDGAEAIGARIKLYRTEKGLTAAQLAAGAEISRSYLSELENGKGEHKRPSAQVLYRIGSTLGISMSDLLGRPLITEPDRTRPESLLRFAKARNLPDGDVEMLASIRFRGEAPQTPARWEFIYNAIKSSAGIDRTSADHTPEEPRPGA